MADTNTSFEERAFEFTDSFFNSSREDWSSDDESFVSPSLQVKQRLSKFNNNLKIGLSNVQSLIPHFSELASFVIAGNFDIVALTETWLKPAISDNLLTIPGYHLIRNDRLHKGSGGVAAYIKSNLKATTVSAPISNNDNIEQLWLKIRIKTNDLTVGIVYRPPSLPISSLHDIDSSLFQFGTDTDDVILLGDFNVNVLKQSAPGTQFIQNMCNIHDLVQIVDNPTYICNNADSLLDLVMVRQRDKISLIDQVIQPGISHHNFIYFTYDIPVSQQNVNFVTTRNWKNIDVDALNYAAANAPWNLVYNEVNVNDKVDTMNNIVTSLLDSYVPYVTFKAKHPPSPWFNEDINSFMKKRDRAKALFNRTKSPVHWDKYKTLRNKVKSLVRNARVKKFDSCINNEKNSKKFWHHLKQLHVQDSSRNKNETNINPDEINHYFIDNQKPKNFDPCLVRQQINHFQNIQPASSFSLETTTETEVMDIICSISTNAAGSDDINLKAIKLLLPFILPVITHVINYSITSSM